MDYDDFTSPIQVFDLYKELIIKCTNAVGLYIDLSAVCK